MSNWLEMQVAVVRPTGRDRKFAYEISLEQSIQGNSRWILIPEDVAYVAVQLTFSDGGRAKVQTTLSPIQTVKNGSPIAVDWTNGIIAEDCNDICIPVTAIRVVLDTDIGSVKLEARAQ